MKKFEDYIQYVEEENNNDHGNSRFATYTVGRRRMCDVWSCRPRFHLSQQLDHIEELKYYLRKLNIINIGVYAV